MFRKLNTTARVAWVLAGGGFCLIGVMWLLVPGRAGSPHLNATCIGTRWSPSGDLACFVVSNSGSRAARLLDTYQVAGEKTIYQITNGTMVLREHQFRLIEHPIQVPQGKILLTFEPYEGSASVMVRDFRQCLHDWGLPVKPRVQLVYYAEAAWHP